MKNFTLFLLAAGSLLAASNAVDSYSAKDLAAIKDRLSAKHPVFQSEQLKRYSNHYTMVAHREATGSSEIHEHEADILVIQDGDGTLVTGGKLLNSHVEKAGELRGTGISGGENLHYGPGDVFHIPAGVPHQLLVEKGKQVTYFVVKVTGQ